MFAFHGQFDEEFDGPQAGTWSRDVDTVTDGKFIFVDKTATLSVTNILIDIKKHFTKIYFHSLEKKYISGPLLSTRENIITKLMEYMRQKVIK